MAINEDERLKINNSNSSHEQIKQLPGKSSNVSASIKSLLLSLLVKLTEKKLNIIIRIYYVKAIIVKCELEVGMKTAQKRYRFPNS